MSLLLYHIDVNDWIRKNIRYYTYKRLDKDLIITTKKK